VVTNSAVNRTQRCRVDLDSKQEIARFIDAFYAKVLRDQRLAPLFIEVAEIKLDVHLGHIRQYWEKLLLGETDYRRHTMNIHRALHVEHPLEPADFERWLLLFQETIDERYGGPKAERAVQVAQHIAGNMLRSLCGEQAAC
jgi:hemoglobin